MHLKTTSSSPLYAPVLVVMLALVGCATQTAEAPESGEDMICSRETPVGTKFPVVRCRTKEQVERDRRDADQFRNAVKPGMPSSAGTAGN